MSDKVIFARLAALFSIFFLLGVGEGRAQAGEMKLEVQLVWAASTNRSPDPNHKEVSPEVKSKLQSLPLKWNNFFLVKSEKMSVPTEQTKKVPLSEKCAIEIKNLDNKSVEVNLFGKGQKVVERTQALPKDEILVLGGNAPNATSWLVVIKRTQ